MIPKVWRAGVMAAWLVAALPLAAQAASPFVPLDHPAYLQLQSWSALGIITEPVGHIQPITWQRLEQLLEGATPNNDGERARIRHLRAEAKRHAGPHRRGAAALEIAVITGRTEPRTFPSLPVSSDNPPLANNGGLRLDGHFGLDAQLRLEGRISQRLVVSINPRLISPGMSGGNPGWQEGYLLTEWGPITASAGRQPFRWGPGKYGGYLLTGNAAPLPALRLKSSHALELPWFLKPLGHLAFDGFVSRLEGDRVVPHPLLSGLRLEWHPPGPLIIGASRTTMLGGKGRPSLGLEDWFTIMTGKNLRGDADTSNSIASVDMVLALPNPFASGHMQAYAEWAGEDEANSRPIKPAVRGGFLIPGLGQDGSYTARLEYAASDVFYDHQKWGHQVWYGHTIYSSGYTYRGQIIGDPMGPDGRSAQVCLSHFQPHAFSEISLGWRAHRFSDLKRQEQWSAHLTRQSPVLRTHAITWHLRVARNTNRPNAETRWEGFVAAQFDIQLN
jgi:hypothetical protein